MFGKAAGDRFNTAGFKRGLAAQLKKIRERRFGENGLYITNEPDKKKKISKWKVQTNDNASIESVFSRHGLDDIDETNLKTKHGAIF
jgi:hypothetical protein